MNPPVARADRPFLPKAGKGLRRDATANEGTKKGGFEQCHIELMLEKFEHH